MSVQSSIASTLGVFALVAGAGSVGAAPLSTAQIDRIVARSMAEFQVPGIAVGIVKDGKLVFAKGYGVRELGKPGKIDADTIFAIGSNTKAFTTAALAILVDEGKLKWDDRVIDYLPDFRMYDPYVTREFTVRDLLTHRSGLGLGAGDLMFVPETDFTRRDVMRALRHLKPVTSFRSQFAYDNLLYVMAGEVVAAVSGSTWEDFVSERVLQPLGMSGCAVSAGRLPATTNVAAPHSMVEGKLQKVAPLDVTLVGPAGGIQCSITGMSKWLAVQLARGQLPGGKTLFSADQSEEMWTPQTPLAAQGKRAELTRTHFVSYGLGWGLEDFDGYKHIAHDGGVLGMVTHVSLMPELELGVLVFTNQQDGMALSAISLPILEAYAGVTPHDWVALSKAAKDKQAQAAAAHAKAAAPAPAEGVDKLDLAPYAGTYEDPWRGPVSIVKEGGGLRLTFSHTKGLTGPMTPLRPDVFVVHWDDRSLDADAYVRFKTEMSGKVVGFTMQAVSETTDFSFDFQDLEFTRAAH
jgi:CubicO group peptidase (beta-lactamase class C family)